MQCSQALNLMDAWVDGDIDSDDRLEFESHVNGCAACRTAIELLRTQDAELRQLFEPHRAAATRIADSVMTQLRISQLASPQQKWHRFHSWISPVLGVAVGFLLALLIYQPWKSATRNDHEPPIEVTKAVPNPETMPSNPIAASLVLTTGQVEVRQPNAGEWSAVPNLPVFTCPTSSSIRTGLDVRCELETPEGCVIRLDGQSEVVLQSSDTIEVKRGQIWCQAPPKSPLKVLAPGPLKPSADGTPRSNTVFSSPGCVFTCESSDGAVHVMSAKGDVQVQCADDRQVLKHGENISIVDGRMTRPAESSDPLLDASWIQPLLAKKGYTNPELESRVNLLLARVGKTKMSTLYEREIRSLGDYSALPLVRYVQSPLSRGNTAQRVSAMRILSDIAPSWSTGDLIGILSDENADVRFFAAQALQRLTGETMGRAPEEWKKPWNECRATHFEWQTWWKQNRSRFPAPFELPSAPTGMKKA